MKKEIGDNKIENWKKVRRGGYNKEMKKYRIKNKTKKESVIRKEERKK